MSYSLADALDRMSPAKIVNGLTSPFDQCFDSIHESWRPIVEQWRYSNIGRDLLSELEHRRFFNHAQIYPSTPFKALELTSKQDVRVVILGNRPSAWPNYADGLAYSVANGVPYGAAPVFAILDELRRDFGFPIPPIRKGSLQKWALNGILLLNIHLTADGDVVMPYEQAGWTGFDPKAPAYKPDQTEIERIRRRYE